VKLTPTRTGLDDDDSKPHVEVRSDEVDEAFHPDRVRRLEIEGEVVQERGPGALGRRRRQEKPLEWGELVQSARPPSKTEGTKTFVEAFPTNYEVARTCVKLFLYTHPAECS
jgi:hypothetical protein